MNFKNSLYLELEDDKTMVDKKIKNNNLVFFDIFIYKISYPNKEMLYLKYEIFINFSFKFSVLLFQFRCVPFQALIIKKRNKIDQIIWTAKKPA
jgi:hypothetical protein